MNEQAGSGRLRGRVARITGGAQGIGAATARRFASEGARVAVLDRNAGQGERTVTAIRAAGGDAVFLEVDVTREDSCRRAVDAAVERYGRLDAVVACAGILQGAHTPIEELDAEVFDRVQAVNVRGAFLTAKHATRHLKDAGNGVLLLNSSGAGVKGPSSSIAHCCLVSSLEERGSYATATVPYCSTQRAMRARASGPIGCSGSAGRPLPIPTCAHAALRHGSQCPSVCSCPS